MAEESLQGRQGDAFLDGGDREAVAQDVRSDPALDVSTVGDARQHALDRAEGHVKRATSAA